MKKFKIMLLLVFFLVIFPIFAKENKQNILTIEDEIELIDSISHLYIKSNFALPSMSAPYSISELQLMLNQINYKDLNDNEKLEFNLVNKKLNSYIKDLDKDVEFSMESDLNIETYSHLNTSEFVEREAFNRGWNKQSNLIDFNLSIYGDSFFYGLCDYSIGLARINEKPFGSSYFQTNLLNFNTSTWANDIETNMPQRAFISLGSDSWNLQIGRDNLNWGASKVSNLFLSNNLKYQDIIRFTVFGNRLKYSYIASFFPHQMNYIKTSDIELNTTQFNSLQGLSMFVAHRLEGRSENNKFGWALSEGIMYASEDSTIDMRAFSPLLSYHSMFTKANCNSLLSLDFDFTVLNSINFFMQFVSDDIVFLPTESIDKYSPNSLGLILGLKHINFINSMPLIISFEGAYTSPYLYLRDNGKDEISKAFIQSGYGINFIVATREFTNVSRNGEYSGIIFDKQFLGFKYGGDALIINLNNSLRVNSKLLMELNCLFMMHGTNDINTLWAPVGSPELPNDPGFLTTSDYNNLKTGLSYSSIIGLFVRYTIKDNLKTFFQLDSINIINQDYNGNSSYDIQLTTGFNISF